MLQEKSLSQDTHRTYQPMPILNRKDVKKYQQLLNPQDPLYQEIQRILIIYKSGIHSLSTGEKINATKGILCGGGKEVIPSAISVTVDSKHQDFKKYYYQADPRKRILKYEMKLDGREEDKKRILCSLTKSEGKIAERSLPDWGRSGEVGARLNVGGMIPAMDVGANAAATSKDQKEHEEEYSNPTVTREVRAKSPGLFRSMKPVTVSVDVWVEDILPKSEVCDKQLEGLMERVETGHDAILEVGTQAVTQTVVDKASKISGKMVDVKAKNDAKAKVNFPPVATPEQIEDGVHLERLQTEVKRINDQIATLRQQRTEAREKYKANEEDEFLAEEYKDEAKEISKSIKKHQERVEDLQDQIGILLKREGKEEEKN